MMKPLLAPLYRAVALLVDIPLQMAAVFESGCPALEFVSHSADGNRPGGLLLSAHTI